MGRVMRPVEPKPKKENHSVKKVDKFASTLKTVPAEVLKAAADIDCLYNRIIVWPDQLETITAGGIIIPDSADKPAPVIGTVLRVGPGDSKEMILQPGDRVMYSKYGGTDITYKEVAFKSFHDTDIICRVK